MLLKVSQHHRQCMSVRQKEKGQNGIKGQTVHCNVGLCEVIDTDRSMRSQASYTEQRLVFLLTKHTQTTVSKSKDMSQTSWIQKLALSCLCPTLTY